MVLSPPLATRKHIAYDNDTPGKGFRYPYLFDGVGWCKHITSTSDGELGFR